MDKELEVARRLAREAGLQRYPVILRLAQQPDPAQLAQKVQGLPQGQRGGKLLEALKAFSVAHAADPWSKIMIGPYEAFLRQAKDLKISDKGEIEKLVNVNKGHIARAVLEATGSVLTNKYSEGYPASATTAATRSSTRPRSWPGSG